MLNRNLGLGALIAALTLTAYAGVATAATKLAKKQFIKIGNGTEPRELDPAKSTGVPEMTILTQLFEGLTTYDPVTMEVIPGAAKSWSVSKDGLTYTFKLRSGLKWSDGSPLTADDFVYGWRRALSPKTASEYAYQMYYVKNAKAYNEGKIKDPKKLGVKAIGKDTVEVTLEAPTTYFLTLTAFPTYFPTPKKVIEKYGEDKWYQKGKMVSNGPFKLKDWKINKNVTVEKNPQYWDAKNVTLQGADFLPIENLDTEDKSFRSGRLHMTSQVPLSKIDYYRNQKKKGKADAFRIDPYLGSYFYRINVTRKPFNDRRIREALSLALDRKLIVERVTKGGQFPATSYTPKNTAGYNGPTNLNASATKADIAKARKLLADAGYPGGKGLPTIELLYNTNEAHKKVAVAIQSMWKKNLGVNVELVNQEWKVYLNSQQKLDFTASRAGWIGDYPDPNTFLDLFVSDGQQNQTGWKNKEYDSYIAKAATEKDNAKRFELFKKAEEVLLRELPIIPIYHYTRVFQLVPQIKLRTPKGKIVDYAPNILGRVFLKNYVLTK